MRLEPGGATEKARLCDIQREVDAQGMNRWVEELLQRHADTIRCGKYQSVFRCMDIQDRDVLIGAAGRLAGMRVLVSRDSIRGEVDVHGEPVFTVTEDSAAGYATIPFAQIFALCNTLRDKLQELLTPEFYRVPLVGGIKSVILGDEPQEIVNYYLPEVELFGKGDRFSLFSAEYITEQLDLPALPEEPRKETYTPCPIGGREEYPGRADYLARMAGVLDKLKSDYVQKVVISRKCTVAPAKSFDRLDYAAYLLDRYFQEYFYLFRQGEEAYWTGISPEIIMKQQGNRAVTKPLAGTVKKYGDPAVDEQGRQELASNPKFIVEHEHALNFMFDQLKNADIGEVKIDKNKTVFETPYAFHLKSEISVRLKEHLSCFDVVGAMYPPATIWGIPVDRTEHILAEAEPFHREHFTGVYGYWNYEGDADTALVIRTAKIEEGTVSFYAGGGIVKDSDPEEEFEETVNKMRPLRSYFVE